MRSAAIRYGLDLRTADAVAHNARQMQPAEYAWLKTQTFQPPVRAALVRAHPVTGQARDAATTYEYGIGYANGDWDEPHRDNMTQEEAEQWMVEWVQMSGRRIPFQVIRRRVGAWESAK
jgi:hypothetical protein